MDWNEAVIKLGAIIRQRFDEIRRDIPADELVASAIQSLSPIRPMGQSVTLSSPDGPVDIDINIMAEVINNINDIHKNKMRDFANSIGVVLSDGLSKVDRAEVLKEEGDSLHIVVDCMRMRIEKDMVVKILALGAVP